MLSSLGVLSSAQLGPSTSYPAVPSRAVLLNFPAREETASLAASADVGEQPPLP